jgi:hypothetical protein
VPEEVVNELKGVHVGHDEGKGKLSWNIKACELQLKICPKKGG